MKKIPIGTKSFSRLVEGNYYFVDKTLMIKEFLDRVTDVTLITRPRRFGKTINMSMMAEFFDITKDSKEIFKGTKSWKHLMQLKSINIQQSLSLLRMPKEIKKQLFRR